MNINRHNYELFFLLYVDNELCVTERKALELFVKENADLQKELDMLQQSIMPVDNITFNFKSSLLKPEKFSAAIEENLLLYIDEELNKKEREAFELAMFNDENITTELKVLQLTKLLPDTNIIFADKQSLYRKENNRVIPFGWWRVAAAAVFIGFGIWGTAVYFNSSNKVDVKGVASTKGDKPAGTIKNMPKKQPLIETAITTTTQQPIPVQIIVKKSVQASVQVKQQATLPQEENKALVKEQKINVKPDNNLPKPYFEKLNNKESNNNNVASVTQEMQQINTNIPANTDTQTKSVETNNNAYAAVFNDNSDHNKEDRFTLSDDEPKKSKLGGFLRKAKRVLERNTKMKSGDNNVKVANLEFAIQ